MDRFKDAVSRLISILKLQKRKRVNFTDLVNVLKNRPDFRLEFSGSILTTDQESAASRRLSVNLMKVSNQLA